MFGLKLVPCIVRNFGWQHRSYKLERVHYIKVTNTWREQSKSHRYAKRTIV